MGWVRINPRHRERLGRQRLVTAGDFLCLPGVILCGHPDRHVLRVEGGVLKKEHRVPWRDRLVNFFAGFGFVSKSAREAKLLRRLALRGIPSPEVLAHGEHGRQAFLLLRAEPNVTEIRDYLRQQPSDRKVIARALGRELSRMHTAGFGHGDLYSKHILVGPGPRFCFLDWQRARQRRRLSWTQRLWDLATVDATLPDELASAGVRLACLRAYLADSSRMSLKHSARIVLRMSARLQQKPRIRALRQLPPVDGAQSLVWLDGEALCVTRAFRDEMGDQVPDWLRFRDPVAAGVELTRVSLGGDRAVDLVYRTVARRISNRLFSKWQPAPAPEVRHAALLFRLERHNIQCPKLLAFGQRQTRPWRQSFVLSEALPTTGTLRERLADSGSRSERGRLLRRAGALLRGLHEAGYALTDHDDFADVCAIQDKDRLALTRIDGINRQKKLWSQLALMDLPRLHERHPLRRPETMRFFLGYLGVPRLTSAGRKLARTVLALSRSEVAR
jgi:tRNA A-37 threonylcarbamoyl transferase component Bud32